MTVSSSINSALSGLNAQAAALTNISNNVANASTVGYKKGDTEFESMVYGAAAPTSGVIGGVATSTRMDISLAGQLESTGISTDLAINGSGFLVVNKDSASGGEYMLTRAGSFRPDANGNLVNAGGFYLQGQQITGAAATTATGIEALTTVNVSSLSATAAPTSALTFNANLPAGETAFSTTAPAPHASKMTYYDALGTAQTLRFQFTPTQPGSATEPPTNTWSMDIFDSAATSGAAIGSATLVFNATGATAGSLSSVTPLSGGAYDATAGTFTVTNGTGMTLPIDIGALGSAAGMTQFDGNYQTTEMSQNGAAYGTLQGVTIGEDGVVTAGFSNGTTRPIYQLTLATLPNPDGLVPVSGGAYRLSDAAGVAQLHNPGDGGAGTTQAGALEGSNVDITAELTNMIETQRAYSSNAMVIQTSNQMLDTINRLNS